MFLRRLDIFLRFETYVFENPQKEASTDFPIYQLDFLPHIAQSANQGSHFQQVKRAFFGVLEYISNF